MSEQEALKEEIREMQEDLLLSILHCGYGDIERLIEVLKLAKKFGIAIDDVINDVEENVEKIEFNNLMYSAMKLVLNEIAEKVEDEEISEKIREHEIYVNYMDSWFNISALDELSNEDIKRLTADKIVKRVEKEIEGSK
jgi:DNA polymerase III delta prime subunit